MSVIGRLDGQVEEVIINPVGRRRAPDELDETAPPTPTPRHDEPRETARAERPGTPAAARRDDEELPVWLL